MSLKSFFKVDLKEMWLFIKVRLGYGISTFIITLVFVDIVGMSYWKFTLISLPFDFLAGYFLNKYVFQKKPEQKFTDEELIKMYNDVMKRAKEIAQKRKTDKRKVKQ